MPWSNTSDSNIKNRKTKNSEVDFGKIASVFIIFSLISFITAWFFSLDKEKIIRDSFSLNSDSISGPIHVSKYKETYNIDITANIPQQSWIFIEGEVLDDDKEYLFSFGKELWHEVGRDSDGSWRENKNDYNIKVTFPNPGKYYLKFKNDAGIKVPNMSYANGIDKKFSYVVAISKKNGSNIPHFWFGVITLIIGLFFNEKKNGTIGKILEYE